MIGATATVGNNIMLLHGVTLGNAGGNPSGADKRHPTLQDNVVVGATATLLGDITIGEGAVIGAQAVVQSP